jgi:hypothetical protein
MEDAMVREEIPVLEELLGVVEALPDVEARLGAIAAVQGLFEVYGEALRRIVAISTPQTLESLRGDELVSQLLLLHDL